MSEILELVLELVFNVIAGLLEISVESLWGGSAQSNTKANCIFWFIVLVLLGGIIWWELR